MNVKVSMGKGFKALDIKQKEDANRIALLERNMIEKDQEVTALKAEITNLKGTIRKMNEDYASLSKNKEMLNEEYKAMVNQKEKLKDNILSSSNINTDLIESNKRLQFEIERLNLMISSKEKSESKINEEYTQMAKIKNGFEDKIIALSSRIEDLLSKVASYEQIIKQKDKYIQMLVNNKKTNSTTMTPPAHLSHDNNRLKELVRPSYNKESCSNLQTDPNIINNIILLKNKLTEKESTIYHLNEEVKALKKDNANLLTRLKNTNPSSILMKKAI